MKVLMICTVPLAGNGIATCVLNYATALASKVHMHILAPEGVPESTQQKLAALDIRLHQLPNRKTALKAYLIALYKHLRKERYDVVHVHGNSCTISIELLASIFAGCPVRIAHSHNTNCDHKKAHILLRPVFELCVNGRIACGQEAGKWLFGRKTFCVLPNSIDLDRYAANDARREHCRRQLGLNENTLVLGHVGLFVPAKNHTFLLQIAQQLTAQGFHDWKLILVGDGPLMEQTLQSAQQSPFADNILFIGSVADASGYLQAMDVFLLPSIHEGLPFVLIEAQASGLLSLVSDQVSEESNLSGDLRFLPIDNAQDWADTILSISVENREVRSSAACNALRDAGYSINDNASMLFDLYTGLLNKHR